jgi:hypothetical protein
MQCGKGLIMVSDTSFTPTGDSWSNVQLGAYNPKAKFAHLMSPYRRFAELLYVDGKVEAALLYLMNESESGFLLIDEIQHCLRRVMPVHGTVALLVQPNIVIAAGLTPELANLLERSIASGKISLRARNGWRAGDLLPVSVKSLETKATFMLPLAQRRSRGSRLRLLPVELQTPSNYDANCV